MLLFEAVASGHRLFPRTAGRHIYARRHHRSEWQCGTALLRVLPAEHQVVGGDAPAPRSGASTSGRAHSTSLSTMPSLIYVGCLNMPTSSCISRGGFNPPATRAT